MIFNKLQFDDIDSKDHGIYITGSAAFNSPSRDVEMVTVPGRNGDLILDNGRYNNIEVTYPAGTFGNTEEDFRDKICNFRNLLASKKGYQRLTDTYNPDEYRMAAFVDAIEVEPVGHNIAGEFDIVFNCKPQRFLTSGETEVTVANNGTITNPTLFASSPLIMTKGYGTLQFNGYSVKIDNGFFGKIDPVKSITRPDANSIVLELDSSLYKSGDAISVGKLLAPIFSENGWGFMFLYVINGGAWVLSSTLVSHSESGAVSSASWTQPPQTIGLNIAQITADFTAGTSSVGSSSATYNVSQWQGSSVAGQIVSTISVSYNASAETITISTSYTSSIQDNKYECRFTDSQNVTASGTVNSTQSYLGDPTYIDCDLGEVYKIENDTLISLNKYVDLGSDLPVLSPGNNTVTYDNTFTSVKVVPRWWRL